MGRFGSRRERSAGSRRASAHRQLTSSPLSDRNERSEWSSATRPWRRVPQGSRRQPVDCMSPHGTAPAVRPSCAQLGVARPPWKIGGCAPARCVQRSHLETKMTWSLYQRLRLKRSNTAAALRSAARRRASCQATPAKRRRPAGEAFGQRVLLGGEDVDRVVRAGAKGGHGAGAARRAPQHQRRPRDRVEGAGGQGPPACHPRRAR